MATSSLLPDRPVAPALPLAPDERPAARAARMLLDRATDEVDRCAELAAAAEAALTASQANAAEVALQALEHGQDLPVDDPALLGAVSSAERQLARAQQAQALAGSRYREALASACAELGAELHPLLVEAIAEAAAAALDAAALNDRVRAIAAFGQDHGARGLPVPWEAALRLPSRAQVEQQIEQRRQLFEPTSSTSTPGTVSVRWLSNVIPYSVGETCGIDEEEACLQVRAGNAELINQTQAKRLGLDNLIKFDRPVFLELIKDFTPAWGVVTPKGTRLKYDPITAARLVNLGYAEVVQ